MTRSHGAFRQSLQGQTVTIPSIYSLLPEWKPRMHPEYSRVKSEALDPWIESWVDDKNRARALQASDFGVFAAILGSGASFDVVCTAAKYFAWYFVYDDVCDRNTQKYKKDVLRAYREASLRYFEFMLLDQGEFPDLSGFYMELQNGLHCRDEVGQHIKEVCSKDTWLFSMQQILKAAETREVLCDEMLQYVGSLDEVDSIFVDNNILSLEEYWERREATAAAYCVIATIPFIYGIDITREDVQVKSMKALWKHTSQFVHITNDMISMRKEIKEGQIENMIPILMLNQRIDCNTAMQQSYALAGNEIRGLQEVTLSHCKTAISQVFSQGCQDVAMGLAHWSYCGYRYMKPWECDVEGVVTFTVSGRG